MNQLGTLINRHRVGSEATRAKLFGTDESKEKPGRVNICVYNSIHRLKDYKFDYVIVDEAHHVFRPLVFRDYDSESGQSSEKYLDVIRDELCYNKMFCFSATLNQDELSYCYSLE